MRERNVPIEDIEYVLSGRSPAHPSKKKRRRQGRAASGRRLEVVYTEAKSREFHIVTIKTLD